MQLEAGCGGKISSVWLPYPSYSNKSYLGKLPNHHVANAHSSA